MNFWYTESVSDISPIISSRIRLARNFKEYPFLSAISKETSEDMIKKAVGAVINERTQLGEQFFSIDIDAQNDVTKIHMMEKHILSPEFLKIDRPKRLLLQSDEKISIMINEEDHLRIQAIAAGDDINSAFEAANHIDNLIEETTEYAFDKEFGYLTACPTNTGTGLRASYMAHLPLLERTGQLKMIMSTVSKFGITIRGIYGEGTEPLGHIYQISNQVTMGKSEEEIISGLKSVTSQIIESENKLRERIFADPTNDDADRVYRSLGIIKYARRLTTNEAVELLSDIRLGFLSGVLECPKPNVTIYQIMMNIQPCSLQLICGKEFSEAERDVARATYLREVFG